VTGLEPAQVTWSNYLMTRSLWAKSFCENEFRANRLSTAFHVISRCSPRALETLRKRIV